MDDEPRYLIRPGTKFIAEVPAGTKVISYKGRLIVAGPKIVPSYVTFDGLVPIEPPVPVTKKGFPRKRAPKGSFDRAAYRRQYMKDWRKTHPQKDKS